MVQVVANMMVYNDMPYLHVVLEQLLAMCDRVVIQDNGSTDGGRQFLQERAQKSDRIDVFAYEQPGSFHNVHKGRLRQMVLDQTPRDVWVWKHDPDELLSEKLVRDLRAYLQLQPDARVYTVPIYHCVGDLRNASVWEYGYRHRRLFYNAENVRWSDQHFHNQIINPAGPCTERPLPLEMCILHLNFLSRCRLEEKAQAHALNPHSGIYSKPGWMTGRIENTKPIPLGVAPYGKIDPEWLEELKKL